MGLVDNTNPIDKHDGATVIRFPDRSRVQRERTLDIAAKAVPLLQAAIAAGNSALVRDLFAVLGDVADGADAMARLASISIEDAEVVAMSQGSS